MTSSTQRSFWLAAGLFLSFLVVTAAVVAGWSQPLDDAWLSLMARYETGWLVAVAMVFHVIGGVPVALTTALVIGVVFIVLKRWRLLWTWVAIVAGAQVLSTVTKLLVDRPRPIDSLVHESSASYPSGHAMVSGAAIGIGLAVILGIIWPNRYRLFFGLGIAYALAMAWSRTYLRAHWFTDVVGGLLFGTAIVFFVAAVALRTRDPADAA